jgi:hypothetical protein
MNGRELRIYATYVLGRGPSRPPRQTPTTPPIGRVVALVGEPRGEGTRPTDANAPDAGAADSAATTGDPSNGALAEPLDRRDASSTHPAPESATKPTSDEVPETSPVDAQIIAIVDAPREVGESVGAAFARKERELRGLLSQLAPADARSLHRRLTAALAGDIVAERFHGLVVDRRSRLLGALEEIMHRRTIRRVA